MMATPECVSLCDKTLFRERPTLLRMFPKTLRVKGSWIVKREGCFCFAGFSLGAEKGVHENLPDLVKFRSEAETHSDWTFTVCAAHPVLKVFIQISFRPIIYRGVALSVFSSLRTIFVRRAILIGKTEYFMNVAFCIFIIRA